MIELFVKRPATTIMFIMVFVVLGLVSYMGLTQERTPKIDFPMVSITLTYAGASPIEIESQLVTKVEDAVSEISDIDAIDSRVYENFAMVMIRFDLSADVNVKSIEVKDKVEAITNEFPPAAEKPIIEKFDPLMTSVVDIVLQSTKHSGVELYEYADKTLKDRFTVLPGVAKVDLSGGKERQINVVVDNNMLVKNYLTITDITQAVAMENINVPGGSIKKEDSNTSMRFVGEFESVEDVKNLKIPTREGSILRLADIATVDDGFKKVETISRFNGKDSVVLSLMKLSEASAVDIVKVVKANLAEINKSLPEGMNVQIGYDSSLFIISGNQATMMNILIGILLTVIILLLFLGDAKAAFISTLVIPSSIISTLFLVDKFGFSINMMTLLAIGTCLGTLIANALVVIEAVYAHLEQGKDPVSAAIDGTKEVFISVIASSGTNIVVFTPIAFMGGMVGQFFKQFGMTVVFATIFSIIASLSLTPMLCGLLLKAKDERSAKKDIIDIIKEFIDGIIAKIIAWYESIYKAIVKYPWTATILSVAFFLTIIYPIKYMAFNFVPSTDEDSVTIEFYLPEGSSVFKTESVAKKVEEFMKAEPEVLSVLTVLGEDGEKNARLVATLEPLANGRRPDTDLMETWTKKVAEIPEAVFSIYRSSAGGGAGGDVTVNVFAQDYDDLVQLATQMKNIIDESGFLSTLTSTYNTPQDELRFNPNSDLMITQGVKNAQVGRLIRNIVNGDDSNTYKENGEEYDINVELVTDQKQDESDFEHFTIWGKDGIITLGQLGDIERAAAIPPITRYNKERVVTLDGYLAKGDTGLVQRYINEHAKEIKFPAGSGFYYAGMNEYMEEANQEIAKAFLLACILTYMLLVALLNSFTLPTSIATTIITSYYGAFLMLFYSEVSMNIGGMMSLVMLVGLTVNNAILIMDYAVQQINKGVDYVEAFWMGVQAKLKTVLMTSLAIIASTVPQFLSHDEMSASMGGVIIGGMLGSIFFTYTIVPSSFVIIKRGIHFGGIKEKIQKRRAAKANA